MGNIGIEFKRAWLRRREFGLAIDIDAPGTSAIGVGSAGNSKIGNGGGRTMTEGERRGSRPPSPSLKLKLSGGSVLSRGAAGRLLLLVIVVVVDVAEECAVSAPPAEIVFLIAFAFKLTERGAGSALG